MANVMSLKHLSNKVHRNGFDLSFRNSFTAKVGELLPVLSKEVLPGDKFVVSPDWFTRTAPVNTAAFTRIREYYDFFFVPYNILWSHFDDFITQMDNPTVAQSVTASSPVPSRLPYVQMKQLTAYLTAGMLDKPANVNIVGLNRGYATLKLLQYLDYGMFDQPGTPSVAMTNVPVNIMKLLAYQKIYQDFYRDSQWEKSSPWTCNVDYLGASTSGYQLDMSSLYATGTGLKVADTFLDLRYCNWNKDYFLGLLPSPQFGDTAFAPVNMPDTESVSLNLKTPFVQSNSGVGTTGNLIAGAELSSAPGANPLNVANTNNRVNSLIAQVANVSRTNASFGIRASVGSLSILALRQAEALQKWKEISLSGDKDFRSQMQKHWNVDVGFARSRMCKYLGGTFGNLDVSEVVNTNLANGVAADIAGKGIGSGDGRIEFESKDYGILMCVYHAVPLLDYENAGIDRFNTKLEATDFAIPEMDSVGMQEVNNYELSGYVPSVKPLGYAPRYVDYKTSYDKINGGFCTWSRFKGNNAYNSWVSPLDAFTVYNMATVGFTYANFKVYPQVMDPIFLAQADSYMNTDTLLCLCDFSVSVVRNLDYDGLPY